MSGAIPISELTAEIVARSTAMMDVQRLLRRCSTAADRKTMITASYKCGAISAAAAKLLIEAEGLETA